MFARLASCMVLLVGCAVVLGVPTAVRTATAGGAVPCDLGLKFGARSTDPGGQRHVNLIFVNHGSEPCHMSGWPDVELLGPVDPSFGSVYVLPRRAGHPKILSLRAGGSAHAVLTWLPPAAGRRWVPGYLRVVVPTQGPRSPLALPWRYGPVLRQDAATHPGTFIGPVAPHAR